MSRQSAKSSSAEQKQGAIPEGTISIGIGLLIAGVTIYIFFKIGQQALGQEAFKPLVSLWFVMFAIAPGFFLPVEQELSRAIAHRRALGQGTAPVIRKVALLCAVIVACLLALILVLSPVINDNLFDGQTIITVSLAIAIVSYGLLYFTKGLSSGLGKFPAYGFIVGSDGAIRVIACTILLVAGITQLSAYSIIIVITPIIGVMIVYLAGQLHSDPGPPAAWSEITENLVWLLGGSIFAAADLKDWRQYVRQDQRFFRPAEVDLLIGDASKAKSKLGWQPKVGFNELIEMMVRHDIDYETKRAK